MTIKLTQIITSACVCIISMCIFVYFLTRELSVQTNNLIDKYTSEQIINAVNIERTNMNLAKLVPNSKLIQSAKMKVEDMKKYTYFSHINPTTGEKWSEFIIESKYDYVVAGENLANGFGTTQAVVDAWMNSPSHRENILNPNVLETGVSVGYGKLNNIDTIFVVQEFGKVE